MNKVIIHNLIISISGAPKTGKTHLSLSLPAPILIYSFDLGAEVVVRKFPDKKIDIRQYTMPITTTASPSIEEAKLCKEFEKDYKKTIWSGEYKTIVLDPATFVWELIWHTYQIDQGDEKLIARKYTEPNARMSAINNEPKLSGVNLVLIHYMKEAYVGDKPTGEMKLDGFKRTEGLVDLVLRTRKEVRAKGGEKKNVIITTIQDNRFDLDMSGQEIPNATYDDIVAVLGLG